MLKFIIFILAGVVLYKMLTNDKKKKVEKKEKVQERFAATGEMVKDPICGAFVSKDSDIRVRDGEEVHHFCSYECRDKYLKQIRAHEAEKIEDSSSS